MTSREIADIAVEAIKDKKGLEIKMIDISNVSVMADFFIIASGSSTNQVQAISDNVEEKLSESGLKPRQVEGYQNANWVLLDYQDVVVHVFDKEMRIFYDLERIWKDGEMISVDEK